MAADGEVQIDITGDTSDFDSKIDGLGSKISAGTVAMGTILADFGKKAVSALSGVVSSSIETGMAFENSMSNVTALQQAAGATETDIANLKQAAEDYGASTQYTMAECADALGYMALAGWDAEQSIDSLPGVLSLAAASGMDLAAASDMVTDYMSAFSGSVSDYTGEALTAAEFSDKLAYAQANSNTTAAGLGEAYKNCAANLNAAGQQMDTVTAILGTMANQGLKGSESGTALAAMMRDITSSMEDGAIAIGETNVAVTDANGDYRDLIDILADIESATNGMGDAEKATALSASFTSDSIKGLNLVLNSGTESVYALEAGLSSCEGAADEMAATLNDNLQGDLTYMGSAMDAVKNSIYEGVEPALRGLVQSVTNDVAPQLQTLVDGILGVANGTDGASEQVQSAVDSLVLWAIGLVSDNLPKILNMVSSVLLQVTTSILNNAPQILGAVSNSILSIADTIVDMTPDLLNAFTTAIYSIIDELIELAPQLLQTGIEFFQVLVEALTELDLSELIIELITSLVCTLTDSAPEILSAAVTLFNAIIDAIPMLLSELLPRLPEIISMITGFLLSAIPQILEAATTLLNAIVDAIPLIIEMLVEVLPDIITAITTALTNSIDVLLEAAIMLLMAIVDALPTIIEALVEALPTILTSITEFLIEAIPTLIDAAIEFLMAIVDALPDIIEALVEALPDIITSIITFLLENIPTIIEGAVQLFLGLVKAIPKIIVELVKALPDIIDAIWEGLTSVDWLELGGNILKGIADGLIKGVSAIWDTVTEVAGEIWDGFKDFFGINSPSKLMRDTVGKFLLPGVAVGMEDTTDETAADLNKSLDEMMNRVDTDRLQMQLDSAVQMQGYSGLGVTASNMKYNTPQKFVEDSQQNISNPNGGNWIFPIYLTPNTQAFDTIVISAKDRANAVSGGSEF